MGILAAKLTTKKIEQVELHRIVADVVARILVVSRPEKIYLFGSACSGKMTESSDFDFAILFKDDLELKQSKKEILRKRIFSDINVDLLFFTIEEFKHKSSIGGVCWEIARQGKIVYDQSTKI